MIDRVGEVYEWTMEDDILLIVRKRVLGRRGYEWECRSLLTTKLHWLTDNWFDGKHGEYIRRLA